MSWRSARRGEAATVRYVPRPPVPKAVPLVRGEVTLLRQAIRLMRFSPANIADIIGSSVEWGRDVRASPGKLTFRQRVLMWTFTRFACEYRAAAGIRFSAEELRVHDGLAAIYGEMLHGRLAPQGFPLDEPPPASRLVWHRLYVRAAVFSGLGPYAPNRSDSH